MLMTKRKPASVAEILTEEFMQPLGLTQGDLAKAMGVPRKHVNELCNDRRAMSFMTPGTYGTARSRAIMLRMTSILPTDSDVSRRAVTHLICGSCHAP
jgi:Helix-turn-helix